MTINYIAELNIEEIHKTIEINKKRKEKGEKVMYFGDLREINPNLIYLKFIVFVIESINNNMIKLVYGWDSLRINFSSEEFNKLSKSDYKTYEETINLFSNYSWLRNPERIDRLNMKYLTQNKLDKITYVADNFDDLLNYRLNEKNILKWYQVNIDKMLTKLLKSDLPESAETVKKEMSVKLNLLKSDLKSISNRPIQFRTGDPGTQLTSAINPIIADPEDWYGLQYYKPMPEITSKLVVDWANGKSSALKRLCKFLAKDKNIFWKKTK